MNKKYYKHSVTGCMISALMITLAAISGCGGGTSADSVETNDNPAPIQEAGSVQGSDIRFNMSDVVAVMKATDADKAQVTKATLPGSNVYKVTSDGSIADLFTSGAEVQAKKLLYSPDGKLYIALKYPIDVNSKPCVLLRLGKDNIGECVDDSFSSISLFEFQWNPVLAGPIQFDQNGNIYYLGYSQTYDSVLRKKSADLSQSIDLINDNISLDKFFVRRDGTVYVAGRTSSTGTAFFRKITPDGQLVTIVNGKGISSIFELPDNNLYVGGSLDDNRNGLYQMGDEGVRKIIHIGRSTAFKAEEGYELRYDVMPFCDADQFANYSSFCVYDGTGLSYMYRSPDEHVYVVAGAGDGASLWQYWPEVKPITTDVYRPTIVSGAMTLLLIAGYDKQGINKLIAYNPAAETTIDLLNGENIEIYHFKYSSTSGNVLFDGLRYADNKYIVGVIDTNNGNALTVLEDGYRYDDIQYLE